MHLYIQPSTANLMLSLNRMPYKIIQMKGGYFVKNMESGKLYSKHPLPLSRAEAQLRVLRSVG